MDSGLIHIKRRPVTLRSRLVLAMVLVALGGCGTLAYLTFVAASNIIDNDARRIVDAVAEAQKTMLVHTLAAQFERLGQFAANVHRCENDDCVRADELRLIAREQAEAARVVRPGATPVAVGSWDALGPVPSPRPGAMAHSFRDRDGAQRYVIRRTAPDGATIDVVWSGTDLDPLFAHVPALGQSGQTFLTDSRGYFITTPRYEHTAGRTRPIRARTMERCLAGTDGAVEDIDYRGLSIIHGFRHVAEMDGGCVMAHIDLREAHAPVRDLQREVLVTTAMSAVLALAIASLLAKRLTRVIAALGKYAQTLRSGDLAAPPPKIKGTREHLALASTLASMAKALDEGQQIRERFIGILAHDLQGPLTTISLSAELIVRGEPAPSPSTLRNAATIKRSAQRMSRMIADLLDFARSRRPEGLPIRPTKVSLGGLVASAVETLRTTQPNRSIEFRAEDADLDVVCDPDRALQVLGNLVENAFRYGSPSDPVTVAVRARDKDVELRVHNWGAAIPAAERAAIFDPFSRGRDAATTAKAGLGLGLYVVHQILRAHGGRVEVTSSDAEGTTFVTYWPRTPVRGPQARGADSPTLSSEE